jgi:hypothetical protein
MLFYDTVDIKRFVSDALNSCQLKLKSIKLSFTHKILHKMSVDLHKQQEQQIDSKKPNVSVDIEHENRKAKVLTLYTKGMTQSEIAEQLHIDQSTVSRDLIHIKEESRKQIEAQVTKYIPFEFRRCLTGLDQITKKLWDIAEESTNKDKMAALSLLMHSYSTRLELLVGGPQSDMNAKRHIDKLKSEERIANDPLLKTFMNPYRHSG